MLEFWQGKHVIFRGLHNENRVLDSVFYKGDHKGILFVILGGALIIRTGFWIVYFIKGTTGESYS